MLSVSAGLRQSARPHLSARLLQLALTRPLSPFCYGFLLVTVRRQFSARSPFFVDPFAPPGIKCCLVREGSFKMPIVTRILLGYALACSLCAPAAAEALRPRAQASRELFSKGRLHYDLGEYDKAIAEFKQAYEQAQVSELLYYIGQAYRKKGDCRHALEAYKKYQRVESHPNDAALLERQIEEAEQCLGLPHTPPPRAVVRVT